LPHGWIELQGRRVSTLDLIALDRPTLLAGARGTAWLKAAGNEVRVFQIGRDVFDADDWWTTVAEMTPWGALLVRPDQHVAYRSREQTPDTCDALRRALTAISRGSGA
jgi:2,4-dichlorophenol 6-monooxygenase